MKTLLPDLRCRFFCLLLCRLFLFSVLSLGARVQAAPPALHVAGTRLEDDRGRAVRLQGVNLPSLEWTDGGDNLLKSIRVAADTWHASLIRLPLSQDHWFGRAGGQRDGGAQYRALVDSVVQSLSGRNKYVLLDLHWSDGGIWGQHIAQHSLPDDNSVLFWKDAAARYADNPAVLFDLYNEPRDVTWDVWQHGGTVAEHNQDARRGTSLSYHSPGMQGVLDAVRATGAKNIVVVGGLDWAYDLTGIVDGHALADGDGHGILYATHLYPWKKDWDTHVTPAAEKYAVFVGEVGCEPDRPNTPAWQKSDPYTWAPKVLAYINRHQFSWTAWSFHPSAGPSLISGWNYAPTPYWGAFVQKALAPAPRKQKSLERP